MSTPPLPLGNPWDNVGVPGPGGREAARAVVCLSLCLSVFLSVCLSGCLSVCLSFYLSAYVFVSIC